MDADDRKQELKVERVQVPTLNWVAYSGFVVLQAVAFITMILGYTCVLRPLHRKVRRLEAVLFTYKHTLPDADELGGPYCR